MPESRILSCIFDQKIQEFLDVPVTFRLEVRQTRLFRENLSGNYGFTGYRVDERKIKSIIRCVANLFNCSLKDNNSVIACYLPDRAPFHGALFHGYLSEKPLQSFFSITKQSKACLGNLWSSA